MKTKKWKKGVLEIVSQVADKAYQEKVWLGKTELVSSPTELFCELFDDFMFEDFLASAEMGLTERQRSLGQQLLALMNEYAKESAEELDPVQVLADEKWSKVRQAARLFLGAFMDNESI